MGIEREEIKDERKREERFTPLQTRDRMGASERLRLSLTLTHPDSVRLTAWGRQRKRATEPLPPSPSLSLSLSLCLFRSQLTSPSLGESA